VFRGDLGGHRAIVPARFEGEGSARLSPVREWTVAGGLLETTAGVLLVRNVRRGGIEDWTTPGGVIDADDADLLAGLTREVEEETGLHVREWSGPLYEVRAHAPDMGWRMRCEVHLAVAFEGDVVVDDPDGIVVEATFVPATECAALLASCVPWVGEPLSAWLRDRWEPGMGVDFRYDVFGTTRDDMRVVRADP
jgi:8-oxo-dGTP pyrophosphatase MutT (NUDIX family)